MSNEEHKDKRYLKKFEIVETAVELPGLKKETGG